MNDKYDVLKIENQLCFPLYACSRKTIKKYKHFLDELDLTYTQYITLLVLWEKKVLNVKELGKCLFLDSGTLTPLLKKMELKGLISRKRSKEDERNLLVTITEKGDAMKEKALHGPAEVEKTLNLDKEERVLLYRLLYKLLDNEEKE